jgi:hypothetical protein
MLSSDISTFKHPAICNTNHRWAIQTYRQGDTPYISQLDRLAASRQTELSSNSARAKAANRVRHAEMDVPNYWPASRHASTAMNTSSFCKPCLV